MPGVVASINTDVTVYSWMGSITVNANEMVCILNI